MYILATIVAAAAIGTVATAVASIALSLWLHHRFIGLIPYVAIRSSAHMHVCVHANEWVWVNWTKRNDFILYLAHTPKCYVCTCTYRIHRHARTHTLTNINAHIKWDTMILIHFHRHVSCARKRWTNERENVSERTGEGEWRTRTKNAKMKCRLISRSWSK